MISSHIGAAPLIPLTSRIGSPEKFPTHTPTVYRLEKPMHQLSRISLLVPVFTAVQKRVESGFSRPNVMARDSLSESICAIIKDALSSITRSLAGDLVVKCQFQTGLNPPRARQRYAFTSSYSSTSADPRAIE